MICPYCEHSNLAGVDSCERCGQDLTSFDRPRPNSDIESSIMRAPLERLNPRSAIVVSDEATVQDAVTMLCECEVGCVLVGGRERVVGIFTERDVLLRVAHRYDSVRHRPVTEFMTPDPEMLEADAPIAYALNRMSIGDYRHLPVTREGRVQGVISLRNVLGFLAEWYPDLIAGAETR